LICCRNKSWKARKRKEEEEKREEEEEEKEERGLEHDSEKGLGVVYLE
jgi:hypothetical protein